MERNTQRAGLINLLLLLAAGAAVFATARFAGSLAGQVATAFLGLGVLVAVVSWFQTRLEGHERLEKLEFDEITRGKAGGALFETTEAETFPARRSREQFEKFFLPIFAVLLFVLQAGGAVFLWRWAQQAPELPLHQPLVAMSLLGLFALVLFLLGKYSAGLARLENLQLLSAGASYLLLGAYLIGLVVAGLTAYEAGFPQWDRVLAHAFCVLLGVLAVENLFTLVLEIYRPRTKGKAERLLYDSRLVGLLGHPENVFTALARALDYQFGFKVSRTRFYQLLAKAVAWLLIAQPGILLLSTCFVFMQPGEEALWERFGKPVGEGVIGPGFHLKLPWPADKVYRFRTGQIQSFTVGLEHSEQAEKNPVQLWTVTHAKEEFNLLVASRETLETTNNPAGKKTPPVNLLSVSIPVQYQISDLRAWAYHNQDAGELLKHVATREVVRYLVNADLLELMSRARYNAGEELRQRIQTAADARRLGARILFVGMQDVHPPVKVASAYEEVIGARARRQAAILAAEAHRVQTNALSSADAFRRTSEAEAERQRVEVGALARVALFTNQQAAFRASPDVYTERTYLQTLVRGAADARKYILATTNADVVIMYNLEEKIRPDLFDISIPTSKPK